MSNCLILVAIGAALWAAAIITLLSARRTLRKVMAVTEGYFTARLQVTVEQEEIDSKWNDDQ